MFHASAARRRLDAGLAKLCCGPPMPAACSPRTRLKREDRARQIVDAAAAIIVEQGTMPIPLDVLSQRVGISKALVYSYFPTQYELANRVLEHHLTGLLEGGLDAASRAPDWQDVARGCSDLYFDHVSQHGPLLHILLSDLYLAGRIERPLVDAYARLMRRLARRLRAQVRLPARETVASLNMLAAIPEEAGNLVFLKRLDASLGRAVSREMVLGGIEGLPAARIVEPFPQPKTRPAAHARRP